MENILVFKTNIQSDDDLLILKQIMNGAGVHEWNLDRKDIDCVLRIVGNDITEQQIETLVTTAGFCCEELQ